MDMFVKFSVVLYITCVCCCGASELSGTKDLLFRLLGDIEQGVSERPKLYSSAQKRNVNYGPPKPSIHTSILRRLFSGNDGYKKEDLAMLTNLLLQPDYIERRNWFTEDGAIRGTDTPKPVVTTTTPPQTPPPTTTTTTAPPPTNVQPSLADLLRLIAKLKKMWGWG